MIFALLGGVVLAFFLGYAIARYPSSLARVAQDAPDVGPQKFHHHPTPRIGGVPILLALAAAAVFAPVNENGVIRLLAMLLLCSLAAFGGGLAEDITKRIGPRVRLVLTFVSAIFGFLFLDARITELAIPGFDASLQLALVSFALTIFAVGGFAHALNIVDGFNGLAAVVALIILSAIAHVAQSVGDRSLMWSALIVAGAVFGFLIVNYPRGHLFLGDGGAYLLGFLIAELAVLLVHRNSEVSPWFALTLLSYPIVETMFSIYRKRVLRGQSPGEPDGLHLHMLIHKRLVKRFRWAKSDVWANAGTSPLLWLMSLLGAIPAVLFWQDDASLQISMAFYVCFYVWLYWRIVRFRTPRFLAWIDTAHMAISRVSSNEEAHIAAGVRSESR